MEVQQHPPSQADPSSHPATIVNGLNSCGQHQQAGLEKVEELRAKCRLQAEQLMAWRKAYAFEVDKQCKDKRVQNDQINTLTSQLILFESRLAKKQKQISALLEQREQTILRQQKFISLLCNLLTEHNVEIPELDRSMNGKQNNSNSGTVLNFLDSLNDSDSAVVLDDIDSDCNSNSITIIRRNKPYDVTVCRSISDAIETNLLVNKYASGRRSNCFLKRPDILETVYSVEEDSEPNQQQQVSPTKNAFKGDGGGGDNRNKIVSEKRDKFKNRSEKISELDVSCINPKHRIGVEADLDDELDRSDGNFMTITDDENEEKIYAKLTQHEINKLNIEYNRKRISEEFLNSCSNQNGNGNISGGMGANQQPPNLVNYNRVMLNHRAITRPKDVKYKRINKAKSKSLEELRGKLRQWIDHKSGSGGSGGSVGTGSVNSDLEVESPHSAPHHASHQNRRISDNSVRSQSYA